MDVSRCGVIVVLAVVGEIRGYWWELVTSGEVRPGWYHHIAERRSSSKCVELNRQLKKQNKISGLSRNCIKYFHSYPKGVRWRVLMKS